jgi:hypothetical protein
MIFPDYYVLRFYFVCFALVICGVWLFRAGRRKPSHVQTLFRLLAVLFIAIGSLFTLLAIGCDSTDSRSAAIYSPDHEHAIRITTFDLGATGGGTLVDLYSFHGLIENRIATGEWRSLGPEDVKWIGNAEVMISFKKAFRRPDWCESTRSIKVRCDVPATDARRFGANKP